MDGDDAVEHAALPEFPELPCPISTNRAAMEHMKENHPEITEEYRQKQIAVITELHLASLNAAGHGVDKQWVKKNRS